MSLIDIVKSGKYAHLTRINYALEVGLDLSQDAPISTKRDGSMELNAESIAMILTAQRFGKKYAYINKIICDRHKDISDGTLRNRIVEVMNTPTPEEGFEMSAAKEFAINIQKNNKSI